MAQTKKSGTAAKKRGRAQTAKKPPAKTNKRTTPQKSAEEIQQLRRLRNEIKGIVLIALGLFLGFVFLFPDSTGSVGHFLKDLFFGLFGWICTITFLCVILMGVNVLMNKDGGSWKKICLLLGLVMLTSVILSLFSGDRTFDDPGFAGNIKQMYDLGTSGHGGGVIGGGLCRILVTAIGTAGAWVLAVALELILIILLTGVSVIGLVRQFAGYVQERAQISRESREERKEIERKPEPEPKRPRTKEGTTKKSEKKPKASAFFDQYFAGEKIIDDSPKAEPEENDGSIKEQSAWEDMPKRFTFEEDDQLLKDLFPEEETKQIFDEDLPFEIDNMKTGVLTALPDENGEYKKPVENEEGTDYEPPSQAKLEDVLDPLTKKALKTGAAMDEAVVRGRHMATEETQTPEEQIQNQIEEDRSLLPRVIQYHMPTTDLLEKPQAKNKTKAEVKRELEEKANRLLATLSSFKVDANIINITQGPSVTRFELQPGFGVKVSKITGLADDIALSLAAPGVRIEAPIPGKSAIGIEIPNAHPNPVHIREVIDSDKFRNFKSKTAFALGKDISGNNVVADIANFPHVLIAGATGSGKSVCINSLITSILFKAKPDEVKMIMVDPKMVELGVYNGIPHLLIPVVTDPKHAAGALNWAVGEMKNRYNLLKDNKVRNLKGYNQLMEENGEPEAKLPEIVIIIDELADLMMAAKNEVEDAINSLAALARAAGMYLVIATQRPSVNVITGVIKANVPSRISFAVSSQVDSRTIIDSPGAEKLLGKGDMLYSPRGEIKPLRVQGNFVSDHEIEDIITFIKSQYEAEYDESIIENIEKEHERVAADLDSSGTETAAAGESAGQDHKDALFYDAVEMVLESGQASVAMFQRKFKIGYQRAARLIDQMEERRIIGPYEGTKPRQVLITRQEFNEMRFHNE